MLRFLHEQGVGLNFARLRDQAKGASEGGRVEVLRFLREQEAKVAAEELMETRREQLREEVAGRILQRLELAIARADERWSMSTRDELNSALGAAERFVATHQHDRLLSCMAKN